jgi:ComF family protein
MVDLETPLCLPCVATIEAVDSLELLTVQERLTECMLDDIFAMWYFDQNNVIRQIQHQLKYGNRPVVGRWFGRLLGKAWVESGRTVPDVIVPIPLHRHRMLERGYNQSEEVARGIAAVIGAPINSTLLIRARATRTQTKLSRSRRQENVAGAFATGNPADANCIMLIDDVLTTGATLNEAGRVLKDAGIRTVVAAAPGYAR